MSQLLGLNAEGSSSDTRSRLIALAASAAAATAGVYIIRRWQESRSLPPGPPGLPILGCLRMRDQSKLHLNIHSLAQQYGPICSFYMGQQLFIAVSSYELVKQMLEDPNFAGRPQIRILDRLTHKCGIIFTEGDSWAKQRRISLRAMRDFGFAREHSVEMIHNALDSVFDTFDSCASNGSPAQLLPTLLEASNSVIAQLTFGRLFTRHDDDYNKFYQASMAVISEEIFSPALLYPALDYVLQFAPFPGTLTHTLNVMYKFVRKCIGEREAAMSGESAGQPECVCDHYIEERKRAEAAGDFTTFKEFQLIRVCLELFLAGTDTTARSVEWILLYMAFNPDVQKRVQSELDSIVGRNRRPQLSDKASLHYTNAVIDESYRLVSLAPVGVFHRARRDCQLGGYSVPSSAVVLPFLYGVHRDSRHWQRPYQFWPDHFLDAKGAYKPSQLCIPFLIGRRACLGESLARMEVFLLFAAVMQRYSITPCQRSLSRANDILTGRMGALMVPGDYGVVLRRR